jgi:uncharacterized membrane protein YphA (DoxX/SURF4 family)
MHGKIGAADACGFRRRQGFTLSKMPGPVRLPSNDTLTGAHGFVPGVAGLIEVVGGTMQLLGLCTRPVAFILTGDMAVTYSAAGPGPWSLEARLRSST